MSSATKDLFVMIDAFAANAKLYFPHNEYEYGTLLQPTHSFNGNVQSAQDFFSSATKSDNNSLVNTPNKSPLSVNKDKKDSKTLTNSLIEKIKMIPLFLNLPKPVKNDLTIDMVLGKKKIPKSSLNNNNNNNNAKSPSKSTEPHLKPSKGFLKDIIQGRKERTALDDEPSLSDSQTLSKRDAAKIKRMESMDLSNHKSASTVVPKKRKSSTTAKLSDSSKPLAKGKELLVTISLPKNFDIKEAMQSKPPTVLRKRNLDEYTNTGGSDKQEKNNTRDNSPDSISSPKKYQRQSPGRYGGSRGGIDSPEHKRYSSRGGGGGNQESGKRSPSGGGGGDKRSKSREENKRYSSTRDTTNTSGGGDTRRSSKDDKSRRRNNDRSRSRDRNNRSHRDSYNRYDGDDKKKNDRYDEKKSDRYDDKKRYDDDDKKSDRYDDKKRYDDDDKKSDRYDDKKRYDDDDKKSDRYDDKKRYDDDRSASRYSNRDDRRKRRTSRSPSDERDYRKSYSNRRRSSSPRSVTDKTDRYGGKGRKRDESKSPPPPPPPPRRESQETNGSSSSKPKKVIKLENYVAKSGKGDEIETPPTGQSPASTVQQQQQQQQQSSSSSPSKSRSSQNGKKVKKASEFCQSQAKAFRTEAESYKKEGKTLEYVLYSVAGCLFYVKYHYKAEIEVYDSIPGGAGANSTPGVSGIPNANIVEEMVKHYTSTLSEHFYTVSKQISRFITSEKVSLVAPELAAISNRIFSVISSRKSYWLKMQVYHATTLLKNSLGTDKLDSNILQHNKKQGQFIEFDLEVEKNWQSCEKLVRRILSDIGSGKSFSTTPGSSNSGSSSSLPPGAKERVKDTRMLCNGVSLEEVYKHAQKLIMESCKVYNINFSFDGPVVNGAK